MVPYKIVMKAILYSLLLTYTSLPAYADTGIILQKDGVSDLMWPFKYSANDMREVCGSSFHIGEDYFADDWSHTKGSDFSCGVYLYAPISGRVIFKGKSLENYGRQVIIQSDTDPRFAVRLSHLKIIDPDITLYKRVHAGKYLGRMGNTGTEDCHLHLVLYQNLQKQHVENLKKGWSADYKHYHNIQDGLASRGPSNLAARFNLNVANRWYSGRGSKCDGGSKKK